MQSKRALPSSMLHREAVLYDDRETKAMQDWGPRNFIPHPVSEYTVCTVHIPSPGLRFLTFSCCSVVMPSRYL